MTIINSKFCNYHELMLLVLLFILVIDNMKKPELNLTMKKMYFLERKKGFKKSSSPRETPILAVKSRTKKWYSQRETPILAVKSRIKKW